MNIENQNQTYIKKVEANILISQANMIRIKIEMCTFQQARKKEEPIFPLKD